MEKITPKLKRLLVEYFKGCKVKLERLPESNRILGELIWKGFLGKDHVDRQEKLWNMLESRLTSDERKEIAMIFTYTPAEAVVEEEHA